MCGIAGIYNFKGILEDNAIINKMSETIIHRGPDAFGFFKNSYTQLASRRLSVIDIQSAPQPLHSKCGRYTIVYNGEVYNYKILRENLVKQGVSFQTHTDTEVVLYSYIVYGEKALDFFRGMFAFCIWDNDKKEIFIARDQIGVKPLYYAVTANDTFVFGSEAKAVLAHPAVPKRMRVNSLNNLLTYGFEIAPYTFFEGVLQLLPGHYMKVNKEGISDYCYWDIDMESEPLKGSEDEISELWADKLKETVKLSLVSDVPVASYLSGGIDSSAVTGFYSSLSKSSVDTISITFDEAGYDETSYSRQVSKFFGTKNTEFTCDFDFPDIYDMVKHLEAPLMTLLHLPLLLLSQKVRDLGFKVVLAGDGADEMLGGYDYFKMLKVMPFIANEESDFRRNILRKVYPALKTSVHASMQYQIFKTFPQIHPAFPYRFQCFPFKDRLYSSEYKNLLKGVKPDNPFYFSLDKISHRDIMDQALYMEMKMRLLNLTILLSDKMSMASSVELRPIFLNPDLVNLAFRIPSKMKMKALEEKYVFKKSMRNFLPKEICKRKKQPLQPPGKWFAKKSMPFMKDVLSKEKLIAKGYFNPDFISQAFEAVENNSRMDYSGVLIVALFVHLWDDIFLQNK